METTNNSGMYITSYRKGPRGRKVFRVSRWYVPTLTREENQALTLDVLRRDMPGVEILSFRDVEACGKPVGRHFCGLEKGHAGASCVTRLFGVDAV